MELDYKLADGGGGVEGPEGRLGTDERVKGAWLSIPVLSLSLFVRIACRADYQLFCTIDTRKYSNRVTFRAARLLHPSLRFDVFRARAVSPLIGRHRLVAGANVGRRA